MHLKWKCISVQQSSCPKYHMPCQFVEVYRDAVFCNFHHVCFTVGWRCLRTDWAEQNHIAWGSAGDGTEIAWLKIDHLHCLRVSALGSFYSCFWMIFFAEEHGAMEFWWAKRAVLTKHWTNPSGKTASNSWMCGRTLFGFVWPFLFFWFLTVWSSRSEIVLLSPLAMRVLPDCIQ